MKFTDPTGMTIGETISDIWDAITGFFGGGKNEEEPDGGSGDTGTETEKKDESQKKGSQKESDDKGKDETQEEFMLRHGLISDKDNYYFKQIEPGSNIWQEVPRPSMDLDSIHEAEAQKFVNQVLKNPELYDIKGYKREAVVNFWFGGRSELRTHSLFVVTTKDGKETHTLSYNSNERWMLDTKTDLKGMERQDKYLGYDTEALLPAREIDVQRTMERIDDMIWSKEDTYYFQDHMPGHDKGPTVYNCNTAFAVVRVNK